MVKGLKGKLTGKAQSPLEVREGLLVGGTGFEPVTPGL